MVVMAKPPKKPKPKDVETEPDAMDRFERAIEKIVPPKRPKSEPKPKELPD